MDKNVKNDQIRELTDRLERGIRDLFSSERYQQYLSTIKKFHSYSANNTMLIHLQKPDASYIAGYRTWEALERSVRAGETGIKIFAPCKKTSRKLVDVINPATGEAKLRPDGTKEQKQVEVSQVSFQVVSVFDISQTEGKELVDLTKELQGEIVNYPVMMEAIKETSDIPVRFESWTDSRKGYYHPAKQEIVIRSGMSELQTIKTAIHETAHSLLHGGNCQKDLRTMEVEAESIAYVVCQYFGLDTSDYSFGYVAGWSSEKTTPELKASLQTIQKTSDKVIRSMEREILKHNNSLEAEAKLADAMPGLFMPKGECHTRR